MPKTILITGSTDGIGLATANRLVSQGHHVLLHGRNPAKLKKTQQSLSALPDGGRVEAYVADLSNLPDVARLAQAITEKHTQLDVLINNAGVLKTAETTKYSCTLSAHAKASAADRHSRAGDQPVFCRPVSSRPGRVGRTGQLV